jgi:uncharacterized membrane protein
MPGRIEVSEIPDALVARLSPRLSRWLRRVGLLTTGTSAEPINRIDNAFLVLLTAVGVFIVVFGHLMWIRHSRYATFDFDLGIYDQAIWLMTHHGTGFLTVRGLPVLGHHANFAFWLFAPLYWMGAGAQFIDLVQVVAVATTAIPLFLIARDRMRSGWLALPLGLAWLAHPSTQFLVWEAFHPDTLAIACLVWAYFFATRAQWRWYWVLLVLALCWKEDVSLAVAMLGVVMVIWGQRRRGVITALLGLGWFVVTFEVMIPAILGHGSHAASFFGSLGNSTGEVAANVIKHPGVAMNRMLDNHIESYSRKLAEPFAFLVVLSPVNWLVGLPQYAINLLSNTYFIYDPRYHYVALPLAATALAAVEGVSRLRPRRLRMAAASAVLVCALIATLTNGLSPVGAMYRKGFWPLTPDGRAGALDTAVSIPGASESVSATWNIVPHMAHRLKIYTYPNPWRASNWGTKGEHLDNPDGVRWLVIDTTKLGDDSARFQALMDSGAFRKVYEEQDVIVAERTRTGP